MAKEKVNDAPVYMPSSGVMMNWKLRRSAGSGKCVFIVDDSSNSVKSFWTRIWAADVFGFFLAAWSSFFFMLQILIMVLG